ncbi:hypothetical protein EDB85DRAFT_2222610 [Lactarius pseudohatsudake]|nr:hypothetical protein EDB85DRAFT_2222610 [Lactarius pseudohatsudake]
MKPELHCDSMVILTSMRAIPDYVSADLSALTGAAGIIAVKRIFRILSDATIVPGSSLLAVEVDGSMQIDADAAAVSGPPTPPPESLPYVQPAASSAHLAIPSSHPSTLTPSPSLSSPARSASLLTLELYMAACNQSGQLELFRAVGIDALAGMLMWGPSGCGKTLLAKVVANEEPGEHHQREVTRVAEQGKSGWAVRQVFARVRASSSCIIFFDEARCARPRRDEALSESSTQGRQHAADQARRVRCAFVRPRCDEPPDMLDPAMCRPGWLDTLLYVDLHWAGTLQRMDEGPAYPRVVPRA